MLKSLDILVGFSSVMLVFSLAVTTITQVIIGLTNLRGAALKHGVTELLVLLDRGVKADDARRISDHILRDPLVGQRLLLGSSRWLATVIQREELTKLLLGFGMDPQANPQSPRSFGVSQAQIDNLRKTFAQSLLSNGVPDPAATLGQIRMASLDLERANPDQSNSLRADAAIIQCAKSDFTGKINAWFDQTIDRVSEAFATRTRLVAGIVALLVAGMMQLNAIGLIDTLSIDDAVRGKFVDYALKATDGSASKPSDIISKADLQPIVKDVLEAKLVDFPSSVQAWDGWRAKWAQPSVDVGILLSALLISLGAPFWYETLKNLLKLRSTLSKKDDQQRAQRQTSQS